jgi:hypothetical protein
MPLSPPALHYFVCPRAAPPTVTRDMKRLKYSATIAMAAACAGLPATVHAEQGADGVLERVPAAGFLAQRKERQHCARGERAGDFEGDCDRTFCQGKLHADVQSELLDRGQPAPVRAARGRQVRRREF